MSSKFPTPGLRKIMIFQYKDIIPDYDVTKIFYYVTQIVFGIWSFGNSSISMREVIITSVL